VEATGQTVFRAGLAGTGNKKVNELGCGGEKQMASSDLKTFLIHGKNSRSTGPRGGYAWARTDNDHFEFEILDETTRNRAEYLAFVSVLRYVARGSRVRILTDSQLLVDQFGGKYRVVNPELQKLARRARTLIEEKRLDVDVHRSDWERNRAAEILFSELEVRTHCFNVKGTHGFNFKK
jgi:ribonuclease HI